MQFFQLRDSESKVWHNYLIIQVPTPEYNNLKAKVTQSIASWPIIQNGRPTIVFGYGAMINLSEAFGSGETLGEKLHTGDIVTVILTDKPQDQLFQNNEGTTALNLNLSDVTIHPFTFTKEMEQIYEFYSNYTKLKETDSQITHKNKRLSLR